MKIVRHRTQKLLLVTLFCMHPASLYTAGVESLPAAPGGPKGDIHKQAHAWVDKVLKELPDKLDRLIVLNHICEEGYLAYARSEGDIPDRRFNLNLSDLPEAVRKKMHNLLLELPKMTVLKDWGTYHHALQVYYHELKRRAEIPATFMCELTKKLPAQVKDRE